MTDHLEMLTLISDLHKDARGFRPSADLRAHYARLSTADLTLAWDGLCAELSATLAREEEEQVLATANFEARVSALIACGAGNRATALRWMFEADGIAEDVARYGASFAGYHYGIAHDYLAEKEAA